MPDLTLDQTLVGQNREKAQLEINFLATSTSTAYEVVPGLSMLDGYKPATTVARTPLFIGPSGTAARDQVSQRHGLGAQAFQTTSPSSNSTIAKMKAVTAPGAPYGGQVLARYTDANGEITQGQALLKYDGEQGTDVASNTIYAWSLEWIKTQQTPPTVTP